MTKNGEDWGKLIVAKAFKKLPKIQNIAQSGHTAGGSPMPPGQHVMNVIYDYGFVLTGNIPTYCTYIAFVLTPPSPKQNITGRLYLSVSPNG